MTDFNNLIGKLQETKNVVRNTYTFGQHVDREMMLRILDNLTDIFRHTVEAHKMKTERDKDMDTVVALLRKHKITLADVTHVMQTQK